MDYIFWSVLVFITAMNVFLCYDIGCQWGVKLKERRELLPPHLKENCDQSIQVALPIWHGECHEPDCTPVHTVNHQKGAGALDGEVMERDWSVYNPMSYSTKEMSVGNREDSLEDKIDHHNFSKNMTHCASHLFTFRLTDERVR